MKKMFEEPIVEVSNLTVEDVITVSFDHNPEDDTTKPDEL